MKWSIGIRIATVFALSFFLEATLPVTSRLASAQELSIGVVDKAQVANASQAWKAFKKQLDGDLKRWQKKVRDAEATLAKQGQALFAKKDTLSPSALREEQLNLQKQQQRINEELGKGKRSLDQRLQKAEQILNKAINDAANAVGREQGVSLVLNAAMVIRNDKSFDLTKDVAERLNKNLKKLPKN